MSLLQDARNAYASGNIALASDLYSQVLDKEPTYSAEAYQMLGAIAMRLGKDDLALQLCEAALQINPSMVSALINKAILLRKAGRKEEAKQAALAAVEADPFSGEAWHTYAYFLMEEKDYDQAYDAEKKAVDLEPHNPSILLGFANALLVMGLLKESYDYAERALEVAPNDAAIHYTLGQIHRAAGYPDKAIHFFDKAVTLRPEHVDALMAKAVALSLTGNALDGWQMWEQRPYDTERFANLPRWQGEKVKRLLIHGEQGMGDTIHFMRWISLAEKLAEEIYFQVPLPLKHIIQKSFPHLHVFSPQDPLPVVDAFCLLMSIPHLFRITFDMPTAPVDLAVDEAARLVWRKKIADMPFPRIGLVWAGNPQHGNDHNRSMKDIEIKPLISKFKDHIISLQEGKMTSLSTGESLAPTAQEASKDAIMSSAALMHELDLIITVDSLPAHLAATMGRPTWMMTPYDPDWRWFLGRESSIWYPSLRIFRQPQPKAWGPVVERIEGEILKLKKGDHSPLAVPEEIDPPFPHRNLLPVILD